MFKKTENPAACEMWSVIRFLNVKNMEPAEIHRQLCDVYWEHAMSSSTFSRLMTYIYVVPHRWPPDVAFYIFIQQLYVLNILNMLHTLLFSSSKCHLFHNATFFGSYIIHILNTGCAKI